MANFTGKIGNNPTMIFSTNNFSCGILSFWDIVDFINVFVKKFSIVLGPKNEKTYIFISKDAKCCDQSFCIHNFFSCDFLFLSYGPVYILQWLTRTGLIVAGFANLWPYSWNCTLAQSLQVCALSFIITFDWRGNFEFSWLDRKGLLQIYQNIPYFK